MLAKILTLALIAVACGALAQPAAENGIYVDVADLRSGKGKILCSLYASAEGYPMDPSKALKKADTPILNRHGTCDFTSIGPGTYAVAVLHDENSNGKMDTNLIGIPREGAGASNDAQGHFGPPPFEKAAFYFAGGRLELKITMHYP